MWWALIMVVLGDSVAGQSLCAAGADGSGGQMLFNILTYHLMMNRVDCRWVRVATILWVLVSWEHRVVFARMFDGTRLRNEGSPSERDRTAGPTIKVAMIQYLYLGRCGIRRGAAVAGRDCGAAA